MEDLGIDVEGVDAFWETVDTNLQAEHFRLVFVSDRIGRTLRRIIEYLNQQMKTTEWTHQTIVPRVIGATSEKDPTPRRLTREKLLEAIGDHPEAAPHAADVAGLRRCLRSAALA